MSTIGTKRKSIDEEQSTVVAKEAKIETTAPLSSLLEFNADRIIFRTLFPGESLEKRLRNRQFSQAVPRLRHLIFDLETAVMELMTQLPKVGGPYLSWINLLDQDGIEEIHKAFNKGSENRERASQLVGAYSALYRLDFYISDDSEAYWVRNKCPLAQKLRATDEEYEEGNIGGHSDEVKALESLKDINNEDAIDLYLLQKRQKHFEEHLEDFKKNIVSLHELADNFGFQQDE